MAYPESHLRLEELDKRVSNCHQPHTHTGSSEARTISTRPRSPDLIDPVLQGLTLPDSPEAVDIGMVQPKGWVVRTAVDIHGYGAHNKVAGAVYAQWRRIENPVKAGEIIAIADQGRCVSRSTVGAEDETEIACQAARVITQPFGGSLWICPDRAEVDLEFIVCERAGVYTAAAGRRGKDQGTPAGEGNGSVWAVRNVDAVTTHRPGRPVEYRRLSRVLVRDARVPVGLCALVTALVAERRLVQMDELTVEAEEEPVVVDKRRLLDVRPYKVIVTGNRSGDFGQRCRAILFREAVDGVDVAKTILLG